LEEVRGNGPEGVTCDVFLIGWFDKQFVRREVAFKIKHPKKAVLEFNLNKNNKSDENNSNFFLGNKNNICEIKGNVKIGVWVCKVRYYFGSETVYWMV